MVDNPYHRMEQLNHLPDIADTVFGFRNYDSRDIDRKFMDAMVKGTGASGQQLSVSEHEISMARLYTLANAHLSMGEGVRAEANLRGLVDREPAFSCFDGYISKFTHFQYIDEFYRQQRILTPDEYDDLLFSRFAKRSFDQSRSYADHDALALIFLSNGYYHATLIYDRIKYKDHDSKELDTITFNEFYILNGPKPRAVKFIQAEVQNRRATGVSIIQSQKKARKFRQYLFMRYVSKRLAQLNLSSASLSAAK